MKTVGEYIKTGRLKKRISRDVLSKNLKIKKDFIKAIESNEWDALPEYPVVLGFVKRISKYLIINENQSMALLRRDYPPKVLDINPKKDRRDRFVLGPRFTFGLMVVLIVVLIFTYLGIQYKNYLMPPKLEVDTLRSIVAEEGVELEVGGFTDKDASVTVNNQPINVEEDGSFNARIEFGENTDRALIRSISRSGKISEIVKQIQQ